MQRTIDAYFAPWVMPTQRAVAVLRAPRRWMDMTRAEQGECVDAVRAVQRRAIKGSSPGRS